jgi:uncharacterized protein (TIGR02301 family)
MFRLALALTAVLAVAGLPAQAAIVSVQATAPAPDIAPPPPYEDQLLRLSEILGAVHYLRHLCKNDEGDVWRVQMEKLIETEAPDEARRARMVDRFNRGYESYRSVYLACTPAASEASERYLQEGAKIAAEITARYGK